MQPSSIDIYHALCTYPPRCTRQEPKRQSPTHPIQRQISKSCLFYVCISHVSPFSVSLCRSHSLSLFLSQLWRPSEAKEKGPKKPSKTKKDHPTPGQVKRGPRKPGEVRTVLSKPHTAKGKAPKKGGQTKDEKARLGEARKSPDSQTRPHRPLLVPAGQCEVKGKRNSQHVKAHRKTKAGSQRSKLKGAASPAKKKMGNMVPKEAANSQGCCSS